MAHSAFNSKHHDDKMENVTGVTAFWNTASLAPPVEWVIWLDNFFLASALKENCQTRLLLEDPAAVVEEPHPKPEEAPNNETDLAKAEREARNAANLAKVLAINPELRKKGPRLSHRTFNHEFVR